MSPEIIDLLRRIENWRRFYRVVQRIVAVPYYTPPAVGDTVDDDRRVSMPVDVQDAVKLELCWRNMDSRVKKLFLKNEYITRTRPEATRRLLKKHGVIIKSSIEYETYNQAALRYFEDKLNDQKS